MRGQFIRGDGLIIPNNVSLAGAELILRAAFRGEVPTLWAALVQGAPTLDMVQTDMVEPTIGVNGYARIEIAQSALGWPTVAALSNEMYVESDWLEWTAVGGDFDEAVQRVALIGSETLNAADDIFCLSAMMPTEIVIGTGTPQANRRFKYQFFL